MERGGPGITVSRLTFALATALIAASAGAQFIGERPNAGLPSALRKAIDASPTLRFSGERTVQIRVGIDRRTFVERVIRDGPRVRIEFPPESPFRGQVIVEDAVRRRHFFPAQNLIRVLPPRREDAFERLVRFLERPRTRRFVSAEPGGKVAGVETQQVILRQPSGGVFQRMWIEPESGMVLRRQIFDRTGTLIAGFEYRRFRLNPTVDPTDFALTVPGARVVTPRQELAQLAKRRGFRNVALPPNGPFQLESATVSTVLGQEVLVQVYSGDLGRLSLYQLRQEVDSERLKTAAGPLEVVSWNDGGTWFVLMGELPEARLRQLAGRLR